MHLPMLKKYRASAILLIVTTSAAMLMLQNRIRLADEPWQFQFFPWNLFLAWIPFILSVVLCSIYDSSLKGWRKLSWWLLAAIWLLFFPNAPYLLTDLIHLNQLEFIVWEGVHLVFNPDIQVWYDLIMFSLFIGTGLLLACLSLHQMHSLVKKWRGAFAGWITIGLIITLSGYGIFLGRFNRLNSWDIIHQPLMLLGEVADTFTVRTASFVALFSGFLMAAYLACYLLIAMRDEHGGNSH